MLSGQEIVRLGIVAPGALLAPEQIQVNGIDLTLEALWHIAGPGSLGTSDAERVLPPRRPIAPDPDGWVLLPVGSYGLRFTEAVHIPRDCGGLAFPRSSLLRMGAHLPTAVWDAGYEGRAEGLIVVGNLAGIRLKIGARIAQLVFFRLSEPTSGYAGRYQGENL